MTRDGRTDVALVEGKAYGGALKGHASIGISDAGFSLRAAGALTEADAGALSWDLFGRQIAAGSLTMSANLEGAGDSADALVRSLRGWVKGRASDGELSGLNLGLALRDLAGTRGDAAAALRKGRTPFQAADFALQIADGFATVEGGGLKGPDALVTLGGKADLAQRSFDLQNAATPAAGRRQWEARLHGQRSFRSGARRAGAPGAGQLGTPLSPAATAAASPSLPWRRDGDRHAARA